MRAFRFAKPIGRGAWRSAGLALLTLACASAAQADPSYSYSRTSAFTYKANGLLESETVEPDRPDLCVTTIYKYEDNFGNKTAATTTGCAGASALAQFPERSNSTIYAVQSVTVGGVTFTIPAGTFATSSTNALNQSEQRRFDPRYGAMTQQVGPNNVPTQWQFDDFGRKSGEIRADGTVTGFYSCWVRIYDPASGAMVEATTANTTSNSPGCHNGSAPNIPVPQSGEIPAAAVRYEHSVNLRAAVPISGFTRVYYDRFGRKIRTVAEGFDGGAQPGTARLIVQDSDYNDFGAAAVTTQPYFLATESSTTGGGAYGVVMTEYDVLGRATTVYTADPASDRQSGGNAGVIEVPGRGSRQMARSTTSFSGLSTTSTDDQGHLRIEEKDLDGQVIRTTDATGAQVLRQFDAFGNLVVTRDPLGNRIAVDFDTRGRKIVINDPDAGVTTYCYDALGQVKAQQTSQMRGGHVAGACPDVASSATAPQVTGWTTMAYDLLGRSISRVEKEYATSWSYDGCAKGIGKLCQTSTSHGVTRKLAYDLLGRLINQRTDVAGEFSAATAISYDANGRVATQTYPTGVKLQYGYTDKGFLSAVSLLTPVSVGGASVSAAPLWSAGTFNAWGKSEVSGFGNGVNNRASFDPQSGRLVGLTAGPGASATVANQRYTWDSLSLLTQRVDAIGDTGTIEVSDGFGYDALGRLTSYVVSGGGGSRSVTLQYNALGMLLSKSDVGNYVYGSQGQPNSRPHAIQGVANQGQSYGYDLNGNSTSATSGKWRNLTYTSFDMPDAISGMGATSTWKYDESHQRIKETKAGRITWYLHPDNAGGLSFEREIAADGTQRNRHYINGGGQAIAVLVTNTALPVLDASAMSPPESGAVAASKLEYWHKDQLGSLIATTDHTGGVTARYAYDPFGKRRYTDSRNDANGNLIVDWRSDGGPGTDRGFTGHEHLDDLGIIHMNGRLYDPNIGRMMQPDPFVQDMLNLQNYDRYGYCYNSPLICTDPTGYSFLSKSWKKLWASPIVRMVAMIVINVYLPGASGYLAMEMGVTNVIANAAISGFVSGAVMTGNLKGALQGAFTAGVFAGVGNALAGGVDIFGATFSDVNAANMLELGASPLTKVALHGVAGCVTSMASGGKCGPGALSAAFSQVATVNKWQGKGFEGAFTAAMIGGTASALGGGKFANGALTAAAGYLYNECMHTRMCGMGQGGYSAQDRFEIPPGVDMEKNATYAEQVLGAMSPSAKLWAFKNQVDYGAPWDYKTLGPEYENFGNYHYGWVGAAAGYSEDVLLRSAGYVQRSNSEWFGQKTTPMGAVFGYGGTGYFGDDPKDAYWIKRGIADYRSKHPKKEGK